MHISKIIQKIIKNKGRWTPIWGTLLSVPISLLDIGNKTPILSLKPFHIYEDMFKVNLTNSKGQRLLKGLTCPGPLCLPPRLALYSSFLHCHISWYPLIVWSWRSYNICQTCWPWELDKFTLSTLIIFIYVELF